MLSQQAIKEACEKLVIEHGIQDERLLQSQIADALKQAIASGDFQRHVYSQGARSAVVYIPFSGVDRLKAENRRLKKRLAEIEEHDEPLDNL